jgi:hypothetical protein
MSYRIQASPSPHHDGSDLYVSNTSPEIDATPTDLGALNLFPTG